MKKILAIIIIMLVAVTNVNANQDSQKFLQNIKGKWEGNGQVFWGTYKNTKFRCQLNGNTPEPTIMEMTGACRVGLLAQKMDSVIEIRGSTFKGRFLNGAEKDGLDIISGKVKGNRMLLQLYRSTEISGAMVVNHKSENEIDVTISVSIKRGNLIPIIGLTLQRKPDES